MTRVSVHDVLRRIPADTLASLQFLSRYPVWKLARLNEQPDFARSAHTFSWAGAIISVLPLLIVWPFYLLGFPTNLLALVWIASSLLITGALHEDGLADVADGFWGGHTKEQKLEIMRDSAIGTYGTLALIVTFAGRWALWAVLFSQNDFLFLSLIAICIFALSRSAVLVPWAVLEPARTSTSSSASAKIKDESGLSARYGQADHSTLIWSAILSLPFLAILLIAGWTSIWMLSGLALAVATIVLLARAHIGGHTGDVLGASQQLAELGLLFGFAIGMAAP